jgi:enoyl-CoA hydratase/carnithine racemase
VRWERDLWGLFRELRKPLIASLHGYVIGSGIEIAALCDIRIASDDCKFRMPEIALGMIPAAGGTQTLARLVKTSNALDIILTNRLIFSEQARKIGLVDRVVAFSELTEKSEELAKELSQMDLKIVAAAKRAVIEGSDLELKVGIQLERRMAHILESQKR